MDGVAAEVAEEVGVFFEDGHLNAGAGEKEAEHDAGGAAADDASGGGEGLGLGWVHGGLRVRILLRGVRELEAEAGDAVEFPGSRNESKRRSAGGPGESARRV
jgi:hypothetical protein